MTRRRFYAPPSAFTSDGARVALSPEESQHLRGVLRLGPGDEAYVFDGEGREFRCGVESDGQERKRKGGAEAQLVVIESVVPQSPESPLALTLAVGLLKGEKFDLVMQKATELGVVRVVPVSTKRADVRLRDERDAEVRRARWQRLALEAAKQSGRAVVPQVSPPVTFESLLADVAAGVTFGDRLLFTERQGRGLRERAGGGANETRPTALLALTGPEGGWDDEELEAARAAGWSLITLGGRTLRAETAAIVIAALLQHLWGDVG